MIQRRKLFRRFAITAAVLGVLAAVVVWVLPPIVASQLTTRLSEALGRRVSVGKVRLNPLTLSVTIESLAIQEADGNTPFLAWRRLYVNADALGSLFGEWVVSAIELDGLAVRAQVNPDGSLNVSDILRRLAAGTAAAPAEPAERAEPARPVRIGRLAVSGARVDAADLSRPLPFQTTVGPLTFELTEFRTVAERGAPYRFEAVTESGEKLAWSGTLRAEPFQSEGEFRLENITLPKYAPFYVDRIRADVKSGTLSVRAKYEIDLSAAHRVMTLAQGAVELRNLAVHERGGAEPIVQLPAVDISDIAADALTLKGSIGAVTVSGGRIQAHRDASGAINLLGLLPPATEGGSAGSPTPAKPGPAPDVRLGSLAIKDVAIDWIDEIGPRAARFGVSNLNVSVRDVSLAAGAVIPVDVRFAWAPQGEVHVAGTVGLNPLFADLTTKVGAFALLPLSPYVEPFAKVHITQGSISAQMHTRATLGSERAVEAVAEGDVSLEGFGLVDGTLNEELAGVGALQVRGLKAVAGADVRASIEEISITAPYARVLVAPDKTLNLATLATSAEAAPRKDTGGEAAAASADSAVGAVATVATAADVPPAAAKRPTIEIGRIVIAEGDFRFTDRSVQPAVSMGVSKFGGTIAGLSSVNPARGDVDLKAVVDGSGPVAITGKLDPLGAKPSVALNVDVRNVDLVPLSPYTGKFAGYELARGKLAIDVKLALEGTKIDSANVVTLNQFTFGGPVASPDATKLPVRLAVALLKDLDGKIVIDLPVQGSTDDPSFRIGRVVLRVVTNLLTKAAVSPFTLLGAAFGGGGEELAFQEFVPGAVELQPAEMAKLETMTKALANRPGLSLDLNGSYDVAADTYALKQSKLAERVRRTVWEQRRQKDPNTPPPAEIVVTEQEHAATIKTLFDQQFPPGTQFGTPLPQPPQVVAPPPAPPAGVFKRVLRVITFASQREHRRVTQQNAKAAAAHEQAVAVAVASGLPVPEMTARLAEATTVDEADLRALAQARAERVREYFVSRGIAAERVFLANTGSGEANAKGPRVFLALQ